MTYLIEGNRDLIRDFSCMLDTGNLMVKIQLMEIWSCVCLYSPRGYELALESLEAYKVAKSQRYRFSIIVQEIRNATLLSYKTTVLW